MKIRKILIYITAAAAALTMACGVYAEDEGIAPFMDFDEEQSDDSSAAPSESDTVSTEFEPITLPIVSDNTDTDTSEPSDTDETLPGVTIVDPIEYETDPTEEPTTEELTEPTEETTPEPEILWEDTTPEPDISLGTTAEPVTDPPTEAPTQAPATNPPETSTAEPVTLGTESSVGITTSTEAPPVTDDTTTTTASPVLTTPSDFDSSNIAGVDPAGSDDLLTTILWIVAGIMAFALVLILPPVIRKIRKNIIYKYD